jgi:plasmid stability protein
MAQLIVRRIADELVRALKLRAARQGRSAEAEHREILRKVLQPHRPGKTLKELLLEMPPVGEDSDFERARDRGRRVRL